MALNVFLLVVLGVVLILLAAKVLSGLFRVVVPLALLVLVIGLVSNVASERPLLSPSGFAFVGASVWSGGNATGDENVSLVNVTGENVSVMNSTIKTEVFEDVVSGKIVS